MYSLSFPGSQGSSEDLVRNKLTIPPATRTLLTLADNPLVTSPDVFDAFRLTHTVTEAAEEDGEPVCEPPVVPLAPSPVRIRLYVRARMYDSPFHVNLLCRELEAYASAFPARLPWARAILDELAQPKYKAKDVQVRLSYAGISADPSKPAVTRLLSDLRGEDHVHFQNFCRTAAALRRKLSAPPAVWRFYEFKESTWCDSVGLRNRFDFQAAEMP